MLLGAYQWDGVNLLCWERKQQPAQMFHIPNSPFRWLPGKQVHISSVLLCDPCITASTLVKLNLCVYNTVMPTCCCYVRVMFLTNSELLWENILLWLFSHISQTSSMGGDFGNVHVSLRTTRSSMVAKNSHACNHFFFFMALSPNHK